LKVVKTEYENPPIVTGGIGVFEGNIWNVTIPMPELFEVKSPPTIAGVKVPLPAVGPVWLIVNAKGMLETPAPVPVTDT
jgi:hypothetical protein